MKIIVACEGLGVSPHAVHCASFMCYTVERGIIADCRNLPNPGLSAEDTTQMFIDLGVSTIITTTTSRTCSAIAALKSSLESRGRRARCSSPTSTTRSSVPTSCATPLPSTMTRKKQKSTMRSRNWKRISSQRTRKESATRSHGKLARWRAFLICRGGWVRGSCEAPPRRGAGWTGIVSFWR